jgi:hypothetical protein
VTAVLILVEARRLLVDPKIFKPSKTLGDLPSFRPDGTSRDAKCLGLQGTEVEFWKVGDLKQEKHGWLSTATLNKGTTLRNDFPVLSYFSVYCLLQSDHSSSKQGRITNRDEGRGPAPKKKVGN